MSIEIMNLRNTKPSKPWDVKVDRSSVLGNPFPMKSESQRDIVCDQYADRFYYRAKPINQDVALQSELCRLRQLYKKYGRLRLFCWCAPKRCHAETICKWLLDHK